MSLIKLLHFKQLKFSYKSYYPLSLKIVFKSKKSKVTIGRGFNARENVIFRVNGDLKIGSYVFFNANTRVECEKQIHIGNDVIFGPGVYIYDHDHTVIKGRKHKSNDLISDPVLIGNNVWIGTGTIILRKANIGDNSVVAAGSVLRQSIPSDVVFYQKRENRQKEIL